jgi:hypothetical protein
LCAAHKDHERRGSDSHKNASSRRKPRTVIPAKAGIQLDAAGVKQSVNAACISGIFFSKVTKHTDLNSQAIFD